MRPAFSVSRGRDHEEADDQQQQHKAEAVGETRGVLGYHRAAGGLAACKVGCRFPRSSRGTVSQSSVYCKTAEPSDPANLRGNPAAASSVAPGSCRGPHSECPTCTLAEGSLRACRTATCARYSSGQGRPPRRRQQQARRRLLLRHPYGRDRGDWDAAFIVLRGLQPSPRTAATRRRRRLLRRRRLHRPRRRPRCRWPSTSDLVRVWVGGDSMGGELGFALGPTLEDAKVFKPVTCCKECGRIIRVLHRLLQLARGDEVGRPVDRAGAFATVVVSGTTDTQSISQDNGKWMPYGDMAWKQAYEKRAVQRHHRRVPRRRGAPRLLGRHADHRGELAGLAACSSSTRCLPRSEAEETQGAEFVRTLWDLFSECGRVFQRITPPHRPGAVHDRRAAEAGRRGTTRPSRPTGCHPARRCTSGSGLRASPSASASSL